MSKLNKYFETFTSSTTIHSYESVLRRYFIFVYGEDNLRDSIDNYESEDRNYEEDLTQFFISINHFAPSTVRQYLNVVKNFIEYLSGEEISRKFIAGLLRRRKGSRPITEDRAPTKEELRSILSHLDLKGKALVLSLVSSGMCIGEALQIQIEDIDLDKNPVEISLRPEITKTGNRRTTFLSQEAKEHILQWLRVREAYIKSSHKRNFGRPREISNNRLFPFSSSTARTMWGIALDKAGLGDRDPVTRYMKIRIHTLRKFFKTQLSKVEGAGEMPEALLGHIDAYLRYSPEDYQEFYSRAEYAVTIFGGADLRELAETRNTILDLKENQSRFSSQLINLLEDNQKLKERMEELNVVYDIASKERSQLSLRVEDLELYVKYLESLLPPVMDVPRAEIDKKS